jgi:hypothetical protein
MHNKDTENNEPEQFKEYINCFNFAYIQRLAAATNGKVGVIEFTLCEIIRGLSKTSGKCIATNQHFSELLCLSTVQISRIIKSLCDLGLLESLRKKYGWERMVTEKYYHTVKHERKHLALREYAIVGLKITMVADKVEPTKGERAAKSSKGERAANHNQTAKVGAGNDEFNASEYVASLYAAAPKTRLSLPEYDHVYSLVHSEFARLNVSLENRKKAVPHFINLFLAAKEKELPIHPYGLMRKDIKPYFEDWRRESWGEAVADAARAFNPKNEFGDKCTHLLNLPRPQAIELAHRLAAAFQFRSDEITLKCVSGFAVWASRENITLLNNDNLGEIVHTYFNYILEKNGIKAD